MKKKLGKKIIAPEWRVSLKVYSPTGSFTRQCRVKRPFFKAWLAGESIILFDKLYPCPALIFSLVDVGLCWFMFVGWNCKQESCFIAANMLSKFPKWTNSVVEPFRSYLGSFSYWKASESLTELVSFPERHSSTLKRPLTGVKMPQQSPMVSNTSFWKP